ncbi:MAG: PadR family transcriptional regulator [Rhodoglobus sp.]
MSLRYALLALLTARPMTGYDAAKAFHSSVGHVWHAPDSQIYPELRRMESAGLVTGSQVQWGPNATKTEYSITADGELAFRDWMATPLEYGRDRDPAHLRAAYFEWTDPASARAHLYAHRAHYLELREQWQGQLGAILDHTHPVVAHRLEIFPESEWERIVEFKAFAYEGLVARADQEVAWAERGIRLVDRLG